MLNRVQQVTNNAESNFSSQNRLCNTGDTPGECSNAKPS